MRGWGVRILVIIKFLWFLVRDKIFKKILFLKMKLFFELFFILNLKY